MVITCPPTHRHKGTHTGTHTDSQLSPHHPTTDHTMRRSHHLHKVSGRALLWLPRYHTSNYITHTMAHWMQGRQEEAHCGGGGGGGGDTLHGCEFHSDYLAQIGLISQLWQRFIHHLLRELSLMISIRHSFDCHYTVRVPGVVRGTLGQWHSAVGWGTSYNYTNLLATSLIMRFNAHS